MKTITVTQAARNFSDFVNRVHYRGERTTLLRGGKPVVEVIPARQSRTGHELAARWRAIARLSADEAAAFEADLAESRRSLPALKSKWA
jgi:antitoxin (DNA-binding transcriptional repressor) of toxin-antitoxin stability system